MATLDHALPPGFISPSAFTSTLVKPKLAVARNRFASPGKKKKSSFTAVAKIAHAGIKRQGVQAGRCVHFQRLARKVCDNGSGRFSHRLNVLLPKAHAAFASIPVGFSH
jgi:hypothetical protein